MSSSESKSNDEDASITSISSSSEASNPPAPSSSISDATISSFLTFTGTDDPERASSYLEMAGGNIETAVSLFMEHGEAPAARPAATAAGGTDDLPASDFLPEGNIRAPDEARTMRLMDFDDGPRERTTLGPMPPGSTRALSAFFSNGTDADGPARPSGGNPFYDVRRIIDASAAAAAESDGEAGEEPEAELPKPPASRTLSDMFAPPTHLIHRGGGFQGARSVGKDARRWLLVNLQRDDDFACHALNRDVWHDELVENLIREGFIFWQAMDVSPDGATFMQRYNVQAFPHVSIIDPRTGRLMWKKEGWTQVDPMTAEMFAEIAADFCSANSFDKPPVAPRNSSMTSSASSTRPPKRPIHELTEEQQLQAAIRASMTNNDSDDDDDEKDDHPNKKHYMDEEMENETAEPPETADTMECEEKESTFEEDLLQYEIGEEPKDCGARVQIRMPNGGRVVRRFNDDDCVKAVYAFVAQSNEEVKTGKSFEIRVGFPPKDLLPDVDKMVNQCNLNGQSITVRWK